MKIWLRRSQGGPQHDPCVGILRVRYLMIPKAIAFMSLAKPHCFAFSMIGLGITCTSTALSRLDSSKPIQSERSICENCGKDGANETDLRQ